MVRAHPTVPRRLNCLPFQQLTDRADLFGRAKIKYKRRNNGQLGMIALVRSKIGEFLCARAFLLTSWKPARASVARGGAQLKLPAGAECF